MMNYLAHLFLSGDNIELLIGNFIGDAVKGNQYEKYPQEISRGILLHRFIDDYVDHHEAALKTRRRLRKNFGLWSPVVTDMFYDHFLAANWEKFDHRPLEEYSKWAYQQLSQQQNFIPERMKQLLYYMSTYDWLSNYAKIEGISRSLKGLSKRVSHDNNLDEAGIELKTNYRKYEEDFLEFFPHLQKEVTQFLITN